MPASFKPLDISRRAGISERNSEIASIRIKLEAAPTEVQLKEFHERVSRMSEKLPWLEPQNAVELQDGCLVIHKDHVLGLQLLRAALTEVEQGQSDLASLYLNPDYVDRVRDECMTYAAAWEKRCEGIEPRGQSITTPQPPASPADGSAYEAWIDKALQAHDCIVLSENHGGEGLAAADFVIQNMKTFAADQRVVLTELLFVEWQPAVDDFLAAQTSDEEHECLRRLGLPPSTEVKCTTREKKQLEMLREAKRHGSRVLGVDSMLATCLLDDQTEKGLQKRAAAMNDIVLRVHEEHVGYGKSAIQLGRAHSRCVTFQDGSKVPGFADVHIAPVVYCTQTTDTSQDSWGVSESSFKWKQIVPRFAFSGAGRSTLAELSIDHDFSIHRAAGSWHAFPDRFDQSASEEEGSDDDSDHGRSSSESVASRSGSVESDDEEFDPDREQSKSESVASGSTESGDESRQDSDEESREDNERLKASPRVND